MERSISDNRSCQFVIFVFLYSYCIQLYKNTNAPIQIIHFNRLKLYNIRAGKEPSHEIYIPRGRPPNINLNPIRNIKPGNDIIPTAHFPFADYKKQNNFPDGNAVEILPNLNDISMIPNDSALTSELFRFSRNSRLSNLTDDTVAINIEDDSEVNMELFDEINLPNYESPTGNRNIPNRDPWKTREELFGTIKENNLTDVIVPDKPYVDKDLIGTKQTVLTNPIIIQPISTTEDYVTRFGRKVKKPDFYQSAIFNFSKPYF